MYLNVLIKFLYTLVKITTRKLFPLPSEITKSISSISSNKQVYDIINAEYVDYDVWFSQATINNVVFEYKNKLTGYDLATINHNITYVKCKKINNILLKKHIFNSKVKYVNLPLINELLVYFLYLRLTFYYNIAIYPLLFEPLTNFSSIDDDKIKQHIRVLFKNKQRHK